MYHILFTKKGGLKLPCFPQAFLYRKWHLKFDAKKCHLRIPEPPSNQIWLAYVYLSEPIYFCNFVMAYPVVFNKKKLTCFIEKGVDG